MQRGDKSTGPNHSAEGDETQPLEKLFWPLCSSPVRVGRWAALPWAQVGATA